MERLTEELRSARNRALWRLRDALQFRRPGYREDGAEPPTHPEARRLEARYGLAALRSALSHEVYLKNLATLWILESTLGELPFPAAAEALEPGCQDFNRLPALRAFLAAHLPGATVTGLEVDAFPVLQGLHSRADKAHYYLSLPPGPDADRYLAANFFLHREPADLIFCFYPFVSSHPALAWGLPKEFGVAARWAEAFAQNLRPGGLLLVVHQGDWEEESFDEARAGGPLRLLLRRPVDCPFYPLPHPARASVYTN